MAKTFNCPNCGAPISEIEEKAKSVTCPYCDAMFENPLIKSREEGANNNVQGVQVNNVTNVNVVQQSPVVAGTSVPAGVNTLTPKGPSPKSSKTAQLLCDFLGMFGVHRFYAGKIGTGIIWLFTLGCFLIGWVVDAIAISKGTFTDKDGRPLVNTNITVDKNDERQRVCINCGGKTTGSLLRCPSCGSVLRSWYETTWGSIAIIAVIIILLSICGAATGGSSPKV